MASGPKAGGSPEILIWATGDRKARGLMDQCPALRESDSGRAHAPEFLLWVTLSGDPHHPHKQKGLEPDTTCYGSPSRQKDLVSLILNLFIILYFTVINIYCPLNKTALEIKSRAAAKAVPKREAPVIKARIRRQEKPQINTACQGMRKGRTNEARSLQKEEDNKDQSEK